MSKKCTPTASCFLYLYLFVFLFIYIYIHRVSRSLQIIVGMSLVWFVAIYWTAATPSKSHQDYFMFRASHPKSWLPFLEGVLHPKLYVFYIYSIHIHIYIYVYIYTYIFVFIYCIHKSKKYHLSTVQYMSQSQVS